MNKLKQFKSFLQIYWGLQIFIFLMIANIFTLDFKSTLTSLGLFLAFGIICFINYDKEHDNTNQ